MLNFVLDIDASKSCELKHSCFGTRRSANRERDCKNIPNDSIEIAEIIEQIHLFIVARDNNQMIQNIPQDVQVQISDHYRVLLTQDKMQLI